MSESQLAAAMVHMAPMGRRSRFAHQSIALPLQQHIGAAGRPAEKFEPMLYTVESVYGS
jgi:hypothetical protein